MMTKASTYDADAQLFFNAQTAAGVTLTTTQKNAVNQWVVDAKAIGIWTKFKAIYPIVGGTATAHKFNLKNPLDTDAAFRLSFIGGWTHSSTGALPNGTNAYANTFLNPSTALTLNTTHLSYYSRTVNAASFSYDMGYFQNPNLFGLSCGYSNSAYSDHYNYGTGRITVFNPSGSGFYIGSRTTSAIHKYYKNGSQIGTTNTGAGGSFSSLVIYIAAYNASGTAGVLSNRECAFSTIGDGLTDLESQLFYQITEKYQVALGRNVNALQSFYYNPAYNNETNAFLFSTQITDNTIQTATNTLVSDLKTANIFTKMKAIYPMVGGTATTHKFNLVNAQDTNEAFRLSFVGGWTHSANGALPNGTNAYADTFFIPSVNGTLNSSHVSFYSRTNSDTANLDMGANNLLGGSSGATMLYTRSANINYGVIDLYPATAGDYIQAANTDSRGFYSLSRTASNLSKSYKNGNVLSTKTNTGNRTTKSIVLCALNKDNPNQIIGFSNRECAFASIGDGLTDAEALAYYNAVNAFQVSLARNV